MAYAFTAASSQYLSTASAPASGTPMTIAGWIKASGTSGSDRILASVGVASATHRNQVQITTSGASNILQLFAVGATNNSGVVNGPSSFSTDWTHLAGVFTSSTSRTPYVSGTAGTVGTVNIGTQNAANTATIGARWNTTIGNFFSGAIAEVGVWNVALTAAEIASLAKGMTCDKVRPQSLVFYAPLVRNLQDVKGGLTITNNNSATVANHPRVYA
jgi:hypothetical protein